MLSILSWVVFGLLVGIVAKYAHPGEESLGILPTILVGVAGSFVGGLINYLIYGSFVVRPAGFLMSVIGAVVLLAAIRWAYLKNA